MGALQPIPFWTQSYEARSKVVTAERLVNWALEKNAGTPKFPYALYPTPGLRRLLTVGDGPCRGLCRIQNVLWVVSGTKLYRVDSAYAITEIGDIGGVGDVRMEAGESAILIATSGPFYAANDAGVTELPIANVIGVAYQDGYGIGAKSGWQDFYISQNASVDPTLVGGWTDFSTADAMGDTLMGCASLQRTLWMFKQQTTELYYNSGAAAFPFERNQGGFMHVGCLAPKSIAVADNTLFWLGHDHNVYMANGFQPEIVSPPGITATIEAQASPQTAVAFVYAQGGHTTYALSFTSLTMCYDLSTRLWHYRSSADLGRWRANGYTYIWRKHVVGDCENGKIYELANDCYDEDGDEIRREADSPPIFDAGSQLQMHELFVHMQAGVGLEGAGQGSDPEMMLSWSDDDGNTWSNELTAKMGKSGEYKNQMRFNRLGTFRQRSIRIAVTDPVNAVVVGAYARMEALAA